jgi:hypothetical protein
MHPYLHKNFIFVKSGCYRKHDLIFDRAIAACTVKHLRDILAFKKDWNNDVIA